MGRPSPRSSIRRRRSAPPRYVAEARALAPACASWSTRARSSAARSSCCCAPSPTSTPTSEALARFGLDPYVVGGRGYWSQQQVEDLIRLLGVISNPLDDEMLFGALASPGGWRQPRRAVAPARARSAEGGHVWPLVEWRFGGSGDEPARARGRSGSTRSRPDDARRSSAFCSILAGLRAAAPVTPIESLDRARDGRLRLRPRAARARETAPARMANVRKLMRLAREFEGHEGRDLAGFLAAAEASTAPRRARGDGAGRPPRATTGCGS